jgi:chorismate synthase
MVLREVSPIEVRAAVSSMRDIESHRPVAEMTEAGIYRSDVRCHDPVAEAAFRELLATLKDEGDSTGGTVSVSALDVPAGLGDPVYRKLHATLSFAMMSINGATGFEMGAGFAAAGRKGSENNDQWDTVNGKLVTKTNHSGGVQGGISNGNRVEFRVSFKPPSSIATKQSLGTTEGDIKEHAIVGRHDPSIVVRAVPVVEGMTWLVLADAWLRNRVSRID